jgi:hypothetical protein
MVTASPVETEIGQAGEIGAPGTTVLAGDGPLTADAFGGGRLILGVWLNDCRTDALEVNVPFFGQQTNQGHIASHGDPILARPFHNRQRGENDAQIVAYPGLVAGRVSLDTDLDGYGAEVLLRHNCCCCCCLRTDLLLGYRYFRLADDLLIHEQIESTAEDGLVAQGTTLDMVDRFSTRNEFHGFDLGLEREWYGRFWSLSATAKAALGNMRQRILIDGWTTVAVPGQPASTRRAGLLAIDPNLGSYRRDCFAVVPEANFRVNLQLTRNLRSNVGYTFLYLSRAVRAADQVSTAIDPRLLPPPLIASPEPTVDFGNGSFWAHGLTFGFDYRY